MEAAHDLGATGWTATRRVLLPMLAPGHGRRRRCSPSRCRWTTSSSPSSSPGPGATTLPIRVYSMIKHGATPLINALSTLLLAADVHHRVRQPASEPNPEPWREDNENARRIHVRCWRRRWPSPWSWLAGCGGGKKAEPVLHVYTWSDYIKPELVARFETGEPLPGRHRHLRLERGDVRQAQGRGDGLRRHHAVELHGQPHARPGHAPAPRPRPAAQPASTSTRTTWPSPSTRRWHYSVPYMLTNTGIAYLKSKVTDFEPTWGDVRPGRPEGPDDHAQRHARDDRRGPEVPRLQPQLDRRQASWPRPATSSCGWKTNLAKFENEQYKNGIASGEFLLVHGYSGDILQVQAENADIAFAMPAGRRRHLLRRPGDRPRRPARSKLAHAFINFLHDPAVAAENTGVHPVPLPEQGLLPAAGPRRSATNPGIFLAPRRSGPSARSSTDLGDEQRPLRQGLGPPQVRPLNRGTQYSFPNYFRNWGDMTHSLEMGSCPRIPGRINWGMRYCVPDLKVERCS
ncbi:MAG: hypothetical protein MZU84_06330 [Sphingobacterium sp.]|nr:hypothetical protein [Sphingobacterium sp.]